MATYHHWLVLLEASLLVSLLPQTVQAQVPQIVISPENTSTVAGSTTVLACVGYGSPSVTWSKDGAVLVNNSQIIILEDQVTSRGFTFAKSVLQLCDPQDVDSGQYSCSIQSVGGFQMNDSATFELSVTPNVAITTSQPTATISQPTATTSQSAATTSQPTGVGVVTLATSVAVGGVVLIVVIIIMITILSVCVMRKKKKRSSPMSPMMTDNQAYGTKMTYDPAYGPTTTYSEAYSSIEHEYAVIKDSVPSRPSPVPAVEYAVIDGTKDSVPPRPSPVPAVEYKDQTSSVDHPAKD